MSLSFTHDPGNNIVELIVDGPVSRAEYDACRAVIDDKINRFGEVRILKEVHKMGLPELSVIWENLKFARHNLRHVGKVALVADTAFLRRIARASSHLTGIETGVFESRDAARAWLQAAPAAPRPKRAANSPNPG